jgi:hypothetical protein
VDGQIRKWFLRDVLDHAERRDPGCVARMHPRLPERLRVHADLALLRQSAPDDTVPLRDAEELLLSIERMLGDGSGRLLEGVMSEIAQRTLTPGGLGLAGDLVGTLSRLRAPLERPFVGVVLTYDLQPTPAGFVLTVGVRGQPRATRVLRSMTAGLIRAAHVYCREAEPDKLMLFAEVLGDRIRFEARYRTTPPPDLVSTQPTSKPPARRSRSGRPPASRVSAEVERIMARAGLSSAPPVRMPAPNASSSGIPAVSVHSSAPAEAPPAGNSELGAGPPTEPLSAPAPRSNPVNLRARDADSQSPTPPTSSGPPRRPSSRFGKA